MKKNTNFSLICELFKKSDSTEDEEQTVRLFKCLLLKTYYELSDEDLVEKIVTDMTFRFFLDLDPVGIDSIALSDLTSFCNRTADIETGHINTLFKKFIGEDKMYLPDRKRKYTILEIANVFLNEYKKR